MNHIYARIRLFSIAICLLAAGTNVQAQKEHPYQIDLKGKTWTPTVNTTTFVESYLKKQTGKAQLIIQFYAIPTAEERKAIANAGIQLQEFLSGNAFIAMANLPLDNNVALPTGIIRSFSIMKPEYKLAPYLQTTSNGTVRVAVQWVKGTDDKTIQELLETAGSVVKDRKMWRQNVAVVEIAVKKLTQLASYAEIKYINPASQYVDLNYTSRNANKLNYAGISGSLGGTGLYGDSVTVGVGDNVSGMYHIDLLDRITNFNPTPYTNHGQHINGIVGGAGIMDPKGEGMASHVSLIDHLYDLVWLQTADMRQTYSMSITNNSYAAVIGNCSLAGVYDIYSVMVDNIFTEYGDVTHVFASGNDGYINCSPYPAGFATTVGSYQASKNGIVVGNTDKLYDVYWASSKGPVKDGRIKPEITAIGTDVYSCTKNDGYLVAGGTSMACPNVAGALAALTQRYKQLHNGQIPPSDILKTILLNGTADVGQPGPDYSYGFGRLNFYRSLQILENNNYQTNTIAHGGQQTVQIQVPAGVSRLKVMLYWHDTSASPSASTALVNDLDLEVTEPNNTLHHPIILNTNPANITDPGVEGVDHLNNIEQVTINTPTPGTYTVQIKGYNLPSLTRRYVLAYDLEPTQMGISSPSAGSSWNASDSMYVYWDAPTDNNTFSLDFSFDNGANWVNVAPSIAADRRGYKFLTPNINSERCLFRLSRNGSQATSASFVIHQRAVISIDSAQLCPGYMAINWTSVPNATGYQVLMKKGAYLQPVDTVTGTSYVFSGLSTDSTYYATVVPFINGEYGFRSLAVKLKPNTGSCNGSISDGDLMLEKITSPKTGRLYTSTALTANDTIQLSIRNLDNSPVNSYTVHYQINGGSWFTQSFTNPLPALSTTTINITGQDFSALGIYNIIASVENNSLIDPQHANDTAYKTVRQLDNVAINITTGNTESFDGTAPGEIYEEAIGLATNDRWDFTSSTDTGRLRFVTSNEISISNNRSASMDNKLYTPDNQNYLIGTYNLSASDKATDEIRLEFKYKLHGKPKYEQGNEVWVRGDDQSAWIKIFTLDTTQNQGQVVNSNSISLTDAMLQNGQNFSTSTQIRFGQHDTSVIAANYYGNGTTLDDIQIYQVKNDVEMVRVVTPKSAGCGLGAAEPLTIQVYNGYNQAQNNVQVYYRLDNGSVASGVISSIAAKDTTSYTFSQTLNLATLGVHKLDVWLVASGDTYNTNDSILQYQFHNLPDISTFPYLEDFENGDGYWYSAGKNNSWEYGTPAAKLIYKAASGRNAWKTNLDGIYNTAENSYLYSPCFNTSGLANPMLSFSMAMNIENCGVGQVCDYATLEYATDDSIWTKLQDGGFNWYGDDSVWNDNDFARWHVASILLPKATKLRLRYNFKSDGGVNLEGLAVDDIHIFDRERPILDPVVSETTLENWGYVSIENTVTPNAYADFLTDNKWVAQLQSVNSSSAVTFKYRYPYLTAIKPSMQYVYPVEYSFSFSPVTDSVKLRLYTTDAKVVDMLEDTSCYYCEKASSIYELGMTTIGNSDIPNSFLPYNKVQWVPYDSGYYAAITLSGSEALSVVFSTGGVFGNQSYFWPSVITYIHKLPTENSISIEWSSFYDTSVASYSILKKYGGYRESHATPNDFDSIYQVAAVGVVNEKYTYVDNNVTEPSADNPLLYRIRYVLKNGDVHYSEIYPVDWYEEGALLNVYPNPATDYVTIKWGGIGTMNLLMTDVTGKVIAKASYNGNGTNNSRINIAQHATGVYLLKIIIGDKVYNRKIVLQRP